MAHLIDADKIRAEIERRLKDIDKAECMTIDEWKHRQSELHYLEQVIDSMEEDDKPEATRIKTQQMCYEKGQADMKKQMMEETVDTVVSLDAGGFPFIEFGVGKFGLKVGDKVRVIIVKEDEK